MANMKCFVVFTLLTVSCALAQFNEGRYYADQLQGRFDDGKYRPDGSGVYRPDDSGKYTGSVSGQLSGNRRPGGFVNKPASIFNSPPAAVFAPAPTRRPAFGGANVGTGSGNHIGIKEYINEQSENGYDYRYLTENNIDVAESGRIENPGSENQVLRAQGYYEFTADDGVRYRVDYTADENGFQAAGAHLPTPPPIPEAILRSLQAQRQ
ncbi:endocuticle structural glycoprotein SgAbd-2-like [Toxorhynchites rutilus septentrionalis]|uniref:endocuticle structural glycoprotein SgAbd-2-like n=1 Tax=Toxorhynchites rutilus septentrionalis TaxID=329112 RepID=UPI00247AAECE|nr:endocuticle structural glycoprotein SgAbd-2-like [Toxorhynchites rutilus septentrionalis]